jgi:hypothetical protein
MKYLSSFQSNTPSYASLLRNFATLRLSVGRFVGLVCCDRPQVARSAVGITNAPGFSLFGSPGGCNRIIRGRVSWVRCRRQTGGGGAAVLHDEPPCTAVMGGRDPCWLLVGASPAWASPDKAMLEPGRPQNSEAQDEKPERRMFVRSGSFRRHRLPLRSDVPLQCLQEKDGQRIWSVRNDQE